MSLEAVYEDTFNMLCGRLIGEGVHRKVFTCKIRNDLVVKVEQSEFREFANVIEMRLWCNSSDAVKAWLAPCEFLSPDARVLLQRKVDPVPEGYVMPEKVPAFLSDLKRENFGILDGRLVCVDYAINLSEPPMRQKKANWS